MAWGLGSPLAPLLLPTFSPCSLPPRSFPPEPLSTFSTPLTVRCCAGSVASQAQPLPGHTAVSQGLKLLMLLIFWGGRGQSLHILHRAGTGAMPHSRGECRGCGASQRGEDDVGGEAGSYHGSDPCPNPGSGPESQLQQLSLPPFLDPKLGPSPPTPYMMNGVGGGGTLFLNLSNIVVGFSALFYIILFVKLYCIGHFSIALYGWHTFASNMEMMTIFRFVKTV